MCRVEADPADTVDTVQLYPATSLNIDPHSAQSDTAAAVSSCALPVGGRGFAYFHLHGSFPDFYPFWPPALMLSCFGVRLKTSGASGPMV